MQFATKVALIFGMTSNPQFMRQLQNENIKKNMKKVSLLKSKML